MPFHLNVRELLTGTTIRMRYVNRWATNRVSFPENIAEHSYFVCLYAMMVARWFCCNSHAGGRSDSIMSETLQRAILHDVEEARTGDIHRPFKYSTEELHRTMKKAGVLAAQQTLEPIVQNDLAGEARSLFNIWETAKDGSLAGRIVRFADYLAVIAFLSQERPVGLKYLNLETLPPHADEFNAEEYDFIRPIVNDARVVLEEILRA